MGKKKEEKKTESKINRRDIEDAIVDVDAYLFGRYKSIYLMSSWMKLKKYLLENE